MTPSPARAPADLFAAARAAGRTSLLEPEVYALLAGAGFDVPRHVFWEGAPGRELPEAARSLLGSLGGAGCVLKIVSPGLLHKSDVGGVAFAPSEE
ncbi:MAG TPA: acetate--CoA ligase family protein, partial [Thermoanaerobaculia bacterium]|nr:acetate--CoA ligase family protein [Thermoanaerobaculia bacterium]